MPEIPQFALTAPAWAWVCSALLALLVPALGFYVSINRGQAKTNFHFNPDPADALYKAVRLHGNTTEYVPTLIFLVMALGILAPNQITMWLAILVTVARYCFVAGILMSPTLDKAHILRIVGSAGTYFIGIAMAIWTLVAALD